MSKIKEKLGPKDIMKYQQNRPPLLFIDEIEEVVVGKYAIGSKVFAFNEYFLSSQKNSAPVVPISVITEMLAQVFLMTFLTIDDYVGSKTSIVSSSVKCLKDICAGQKIKVKSELLSSNRGVFRGMSKGYCLDGGGEDEIIYTNYKRGKI